MSKLRYSITTKADETICFCCLYNVVFFHIKFTNTPGIKPSKIISTAASVICFL